MEAYKCIEHNFDARDIFLTFFVNQKLVVSKCWRVGFH